MKARNKEGETKPAGHGNLQEGLGSQEKVKRISILSTERARILRNIAVIYKLNFFIFERFLVLFTFFREVDKYLLKFDIMLKHLLESIFMQVPQVF